jgi:putative ABC transport system ATP-binding protein
MITLDHVTLTFPDGAARVRAVDDASLVVRAGTITAITGPSGSGKSSLLALASTLIRPDAGRVVIDDVEASALTPADAAELRRTRIGIVFQQSNLLPALTALEQLLVMNELGGARRRARAAERVRAADLLDAVGLAAHAGKRPHQLSGGQRQRVNIARALMSEPSVLIVDEPTSALDSSSGAQVMEVLLELTEQRSTATMLVTHDRAIATDLHDEWRMNDGVLTSAREHTKA